MRVEDFLRSTAISSYPANADLAARLIDVFMLEKALYEPRYELENRPDSVGIALAAGTRTNRRWRP